MSSRDDEREPGYFRARTRARGTGQGSLQRPEHTAPHDKGPLLGRQVTGSEYYDSTLLVSVPRANARSGLPGGAFAGHGEDLWHAYELSWLSAQGMPQMYLGILRVPAASPNLVESKSLKLYLNSLNNHRFNSASLARETIERDLSMAAGAAVSLEISAVDAGTFAATNLDAQCLDELEVVVPDAPGAALLAPRAGDARVCTHLMRSLCPVTAQPDWATVIVEMRGRRADERGLLAYLLAYRNHQEFHEQCVERIFADLHAALEPSFLSVQALYTRRGGLDICPWRCSQALPAPRLRMNRQ